MSPTARVLLLDLLCLALAATAMVSAVLVVALAPL